MLRLQMKHELIVPTSDSLQNIAEKVLRYCDCKEYGESEYDFPIVIGRDRVGNPIIADLPTLGNVVLFGSTGGPSLYEMILLAQLLWAKHPKPLDVEFFDFPINMWGSMFVGREQYYFGDEGKLEEFFEHIKATIERRKSGQEDAKRRKVFFIHILSSKPRNLDRDMFDVILKEDMRSLGLQLVMCGEAGVAATYLYGYSDLFDTTIETATEYGSSRLYGIIKEGRHPLNEFVRKYVCSLDIPTE